MTTPSDKSGQKYSRVYDLRGEAGQSSRPLVDTDRLELPRDASQGSVTKDVTKFVGTQS
jgi:hypothetical protein